MTSATERLRALLDERGVEWKDYGYENHTWWGEWHAENRSSVNGLFVKVEGVVTPEQAIAATLGPGTCEVTDNGSWGYPHVCSACGASFDMDVNNGEFYYCPNCGRKVVE